jgi:hypothetical protein
MTLRELISATDYDVYICSIDQEPEKLLNHRPNINAYATNLLKGITGIMDLSVYRFYIDPEYCAIHAAVLLPWPIVQSIYKYNHTNGG